MIHTVSLKIFLGAYLSYCLKQAIILNKTMFAPKYQNGVFVQYSAEYKNVRFNFNPRKYIWQIKVECEADEVLNKNTITINDLENFEEKISNIIKEFFNINNFPLLIKGFTLFRIDYKYDFYFQNEEELLIFFEIISKAKNRYNNLIKIKPNNTDISSLYYRPEGKKENDKYHYKKGNQNINVYYRYAYTHKEKDKLKIRLEIQVFSKKINEQFKKNGVTKELCNYWSLESYFEYMKILENVLYTKDFFRIDIALEKVNGQKNMRPSTKKRICKLLLLINKFGETKARKKFTKEYSSSTFYRDMATIKNKIGINPITFGDVEKINKNDIKFLKNFLLKEKEVSVC